MKEPKCCGGKLPDGCNIIQDIQILDLAQTIILGDNKKDNFTIGDYIPEQNIKLGIFYEHFSRMLEIELESEKISAIEKDKVELYERKWDNI